MIAVQTIFSRDNIETPWYHTQWSPELVEYVNENYLAVNKLDGYINEGQDGMTLIIIHVFSTPEAKQEWDNDEYLNGFRELRSTYNQANNIVLVSQTSE